MARRSKKVVKNRLKFEGFEKSNFLLQASFDKHTKQQNQRQMKLILTAAILFLTLSLNAHERNQGVTKSKQTEVSKRVDKKKRKNKKRKKACKRWARHCYAG
jgi:hypothetical protein